MSINAEENRLSGVCIICDAFAVVVIEGVKKASEPEVHPKCRVDSPESRQLMLMSRLPRCCAAQAITRYNKLMMRRIDWSLKEQKIILEGVPLRAAIAPGPGLSCGGSRGISTRQAITRSCVCLSSLSRTTGREEAEEEDEDGDDTPNKCTLVWQGGVLKPAFKKWLRFETVRTEAAAAKYLEDLGLRHYWCACGGAAEHGGRCSMRYCTAWLSAQDLQAEWGCVHRVVPRRDMASAGAPADDILL